jgi:glycosyltransferase involved in cell wall biosynthesis
MSPARALFKRTARSSKVRETALFVRLETLVKILAPKGTRPARTVGGLLTQAGSSLSVSEAGHVWLTLAVTAARLPEASDVIALRRLGELSGASAVLEEAIRRMPTESLGDRVEVATGEVLVDVNHLAQTTLLTGIQRVTQEVVTRWNRDHELSFVCWTTDNLAMRRTTASETARALEGSVTEEDRDGARPPHRTVVIPWRSHFVLPEVALEVPRTKRLQALALYSGCATAVIGFDTVPLTSAETTDTNVPGYFMHELAAIRHMDRVATISQAASTEYEGWRTMISSLGVPGPNVRTISLPVEATEPSAVNLAATRHRYCVPGVPLVLCVGSHEPRKNHLALLHAAELLWRQGLEFSLVFVGGNAWHSNRFHSRVAELQAANRPVEAALRVEDDTLWALYRLARCTVFPSLNEGFGLPVAESLASGTPVVTSDFGSMLEIGCEGGALHVNPRDDHAIAAALRTLLTDDLTHARLVREAAARPSRGWEDYARETWDYMVVSNPLPAEMPEPESAGEVAQ